MQELREHVQKRSRPRVAQKKAIRDPIHDGE
jgi:hypothetical protein